MTAAAEGCVAMLTRALVEGQLEVTGDPSPGQHEQTGSTTHARGFEYARFLAGVGSCPDLEAAKRQSAEDPECFALMCAAAERAAFLTFDLDSLESWLAVHEGLSGLRGEGALRITTGRAWAQIMVGAYEDAAESLDEVKAQAKAQRVSACLIDAEATRAFVQLALGRLGEAVQVARRASRMAAAEELPYQELFAHLILARVRRVAGAPFLASRILAALKPLSPPLWHPWIWWESLLSGAAPDGLSPPPCPAQRASGALAQLLGRAGRGDRGGFDRAFANAIDELSGFSAMAADLTMLATCVDSKLDMAQAFDQVQQWLSGISPDVPCGFHGIVRATQQSDAPPSVAFVCAAPGQRTRRVLGAGIPLARQESPQIIDREKKPRDRTHTALAALVLAEGFTVDERVFFRSLYGFDYDHALHKHVLDMLVGRMREMLGDGGMLTRANGVLSLTLARPLLLWDPRCERPIDDWILASLAEGGPKTAKATAAALAVSLRTVQNVLKDLTDTGACVQRRDGRSLLYAVEDTTFSEPTKARFQGQLLTPFSSS